MLRVECTPREVLTARVGSVCTPYFTSPLLPWVLPLAQIRTWFAKSRNNVEALFTADGHALSLPYWQTIEDRLQYALTNYPWVQMQVCIEALLRDATTS